MTDPIPERKSVFATPWFQILESPSGKKFPNYAIQSPDFVVILAVTDLNEILLVRQFRHAVGATTLELPAGHVEKDETPEQAARKELREETGHIADHFELIANLSPSPARFMNRMWCYFAANAQLAPDVVVEEGMSCIRYSHGLAGLLQESDFYSAGNWAALMAAVAGGKLKI